MTEKQQIHLFKGAYSDLQLTIVEHGDFGTRNWFYVEDFLCKEACAVKKTSVKPLKLENVIITFKSTIVNFKHTLNYLRKLSFYTKAFNCFSPYIIDRQYMYRLSKKMLAPFLNWV